MKKHVIIIGAGIGGLSAAIRLGRHCRVTLLEKLPQVGGKLNICREPHPARPGDRPFLFDTGPSLLTMPFVFLDLFAAAGQDVRDHLKIRRLDPVSRFVWADGSTFSLHDDDLALHQELTRFAPDDREGWMQLLDRGRKVWELGESFLTHAPEQLIKFDDWRAMGMITVPFRIGMFTKLFRTINRHVRNPRLRDILYQYATYSGASPYHAPGTLAVIPWVEHYFGGWHIEGGMYRLAESLEGIAQSMGVEIRTNCPVSEVLVEAATARGVRLGDGTQLLGDAVIANSDVVYTYQHLIGRSHRRRYSDAVLERFDPGGSGMVLMLGVEGTYPQLAHHTKFMPDDYRSELVAMFENRTIPQDPCIYVCAPTRTDPSLAPEGCEQLFVLVSAPPIQEGKIDWTIEGQKYRDKIIHTLQSRFGLTDLARRIVVERRMTPVDFRSQYNANAGSIYGIASNSLRTAFMRPPNRDRDIKSLYFAGGATHPGGGLPLVALSGRIVSEMILKDFQIGDNCP